MWRVLGFGGKPNPLLYSRAASFAARTAQAILGFPTRPKQPEGMGRGRLQLYVDDPVVSIVGTNREVQASFGVLLLWWVALGVPLAWSKGSLVEAADGYSWISVDFQMLPRGRSKLRLPRLSFKRWPTSCSRSAT